MGPPRNLRRLSLALCLLAVSASSYASDNTKPLPVRIHNLQNPEAQARLYSERFRYFYELVDLLLEKACARCQLQMVDFPPTSSTRNIRFLQQGRIDIAWLHTSQEREDTLTPIRYPIYRGLNGWRLLLVKEQNRQLFAGTTSSHRLKVKWAGLGLDWPDTSILKSNGYAVRQAENWGSLIRLLENERIDYFPRGVHEVGHELAMLKGKGIVLEEHTALHYPTAFYLFVGPQNSQLAAILENGFEKALRDGSFEALFMRYFADDIKRANLTQRRIFHLVNPDLPVRTPLSREQLWFKPQENSAALSSENRNPR